MGRCEKNLVTLVTLSRLGEKKSSPVRKILFANWGTKIRQIPLWKTAATKGSPFCCRGRKM